jgi:hypothetical protein
VGDIHSRQVQPSPTFSKSRLSCINHGISVSFQDSDADCRDPLVIDDDQLTPELAKNRHKYESGTDVPFCGMTLFFCQMNLAKILTHVIQIAFGLKRTNYSQIIKLDEEVDHFHKYVFPKIFLPDHPSFNTTLEPLSLIMQCFILKTRLLLHRPFIGRSHENPQFKWSRDRAVDAALCIIQKSIQLFSTPNIILESHYSAYPMLSHGLFPAPVAIALDLYTFPNQPNAEASRQALLDMRRAYLQLAVDFVQVKRLYKILGILMQKAWEKAGLPLPVEQPPSRLGSVSSHSTPSPIMANWESGNKPWGSQGVVPLSFQQFLPAESYSGNVNWTSTQASVQGNLMTGAGAGNSLNPYPWEGGSGNSNMFPLFPEGSSFTPNTQLNENFDMENNVNWV